MAAEKTVLSGSTTMLVLKLLDEKDMYGYQIIEELASRSDETFRLKTGTLYPILHGLENDGLVSSYDGNAGNSRVRKYYRLTPKGRRALAQKKEQWVSYVKAVGAVMEGGVSYVAV